MNKIVDELCLKYDSETLQISNGKGFYLLGEESPFVRALLNKAKKFDITCIHKDELKPTIHPTVVDVETYKESFILTSYQDIDFIQHYGLSCCANAILDTLTTIGVSGKHVCIVGRGHAVQGLSNALVKANATVTVCHTYTDNLFEVTKLADILVVAAPIKPNEVALENLDIVVDVSGTFSSFNGWSQYISNIGKLTTSILLNRVCKNT